VSREDSSISAAEGLQSWVASRFDQYCDRKDLPLMVILTAFAYRGVAMSAPLSTARPAVERFFFDPTQNSSDVTVFVMLVLLLTDWRRLVARIGRAGSSVSAALFFSAAVVLHLWSEYTQALPVDLLSLGLFLIGAALALGGWQLVRLILLPASLLLIAIPIPVVLINKLVLPLQAGTIAISTFFMDSIGRDYATFGSIIYSGERAFQVIDTCTGLRSISTMFMATLVYIRLLGESGWRAALLLTMAAPISFFFNGVRVLIIILSADMSLSEDHNVQEIMADSRNKRPFPYHR